MRVGVDIGGTNTDAVVLDGDGLVSHRLRLPTGWGEEAVLATAIHAVEKLAGLADVRVSAFESIGVGIPGAVHPGSGVVAHALNLGVRHLDLGRLLGEHFLSTVVHVENDVNAAALGAFHELRLAPDSSMAYLNLGTGLASGLVLGGRLWRGSRGTAGEIGHIVVDPKGPADLDGEPGGLEVVASGSGIARQWPSGGGPAVGGMLEAADRGDAAAVEVRRRLFEGVASSVRILILTVDVDVVVIGGGISGLGERLLREIRAVFARWDEKSAFMASLQLGERVLILPDDSAAAALGAARLAGWPRRQAVS